MDGHAGPGLHEIARQLTLAKTKAVFDGVGELMHDNAIVGDDGYTVGELKARISLPGSAAAVAILGGGLAYPLQIDVRRAVEKNRRTLKEFRVPQSDKVLVWMDLEMTGLDPETCAVVQMAIILTDTDLNRIDDPLEVNIWQPDSVLERMIPFVRNMHQKSGLIELIRESETSVEEAEHMAVALVAKHCSYRTARLCGNSISQDRRFLVKHMPVLEGYLHYRNVDVSTVKEMAGWWYNEKYVKPNDGKHTAMHDVVQSIEELRYFRRNVFKDGGIRLR